MSLKLKTLAGLAALALAGGAAALAIPQAHAMTEHCGGDCTTMSSQAFGSDEVIANGNPTALLEPGYNPKEDFIAHVLGSASGLAQINQVPASEASIYGSESVYEFGYSPYGTLPTECLGASGGSIVLQACGLPTTLWIGVHRDASGYYSPFVNVGASASGGIKVLTATGAGSAVTLSPMSISNGVVASDQMWESQLGTYGQVVPWPVPGGQPAFLEH
jgi:hypothetical protein